MLFEFSFIRSEISKRVRFSVSVIDGAMLSEEDVKVIASWQRSDYL